MVLLTLQSNIEINHNKLNIIHKPPQKKIETENFLFSPKGDLKGEQ